MVEVKFVPATGGEPVVGRVVQVIRKRPGYGLAVVAYRRKPIWGSGWSAPLRECFPVVNGRMMDVIERRCRGA